MVRGGWRAFALAGSLVLTSVGSVLGAPTPAELQEARETFAAAERDERAGDFAAALEKLRRVARVKITPGIRFHLAHCEENTGELAAALADYRLAETQATDEKNAEVLAAVREPLAALKARVPRLVLHMPRDASAAEVTVDGEVVPTEKLGTELPVNPGEHAVAARLAGKKPFSQKVHSALGETTPVNVELASDAAPSPSSAAAPTTHPGAAPIAVATPAAARPSVRGHGGAIVATVGAVVLAGAGVGAFLLAGAKQDDGRAACAAQKDVGACDDLRGPVRTWDTVALGAWLGAGLVGALAVVLWAGPGPASARSGRLVLGPSRAAFEGSF